MAPVKLYKSQNSKHSAHVSTKFARSSIKTLEEIPSILGSEEVILHSMDDKANHSCITRYHSCKETNSSAYAYGISNDFARS